MLIFGFDLRLVDSCGHGEFHIISNYFALSLENILSA